MACAEEIVSAKDQNYNASLGTLHQPRGVEKMPVPKNHEEVDLNHILPRIRERGADGKAQLLIPEAEKTPNPARHALSTLTLRYTKSYPPRSAKKRKKHPPI